MLPYSRFVSCIFVWLTFCVRVRSTVALQVLGKTPDEIYAMFKVDQKLTPEEEELVRKENPWLEDQ